MRTSSLVYLLASWGCASPPAANPTPVADVAPMSAPDPTTAPPPIESPPPKVPRIVERRVGDVAILEPLPARLLTDDLADRYQTSYYADAQPLEGFALPDPPVFAAVDGGPFHPFGMATPGQPIPESMPAEAAARARRGELVVTMIVVTDPRVVTAEGMGVGRTYVDVQRAYPELDAYTFPGLWEEPSCIARPTSESSIHFFFKGCQLARDGQPFEPGDEVLRVVVLVAAD